MFHSQLPRQHLVYEDKTVNRTEISALRPGETLMKDFTAAVNLLPRGRNY